MSASGAPPALPPGATELAAVVAAVRRAEPLEVFDRDAACERFTSFWASVKQALVKTAAEAAAHAGANRSGRRNPDGVAARARALPLCPRRVALRPFDAGAARSS